MYVWNFLTWFNDGLIKKVTWFEKKNPLLLINYMIPSSNRTKLTTTQSGKKLITLLKTHCLLEKRYLTHIKWQPHIRTFLKKLEKNMTTALHPSTSFILESFTKTIHRPTKMAISSQSETNSQTTGRNHVALSTTWPKKRWFCSWAVEITWARRESRRFVGDLRRLRAEDF